jgi:hypothetical protein
MFGFELGNETAQVFGHTGAILDAMISVWLTIN